jgi:chromosome segregation ATPase
VLGAAARLERALGASQAAARTTGAMQGIEVRGEQASSRAVASKARKAFVRPDPADLMGPNVGMSWWLNANDDAPPSREPLPEVRDMRDDMPPSRGAGLTAKPRSKSEMGYREASLRESINGMDQPLPREHSGNLSMNAGVQLPGLSHGLNASLRSSLEDRQSKTEGAKRKGVLWAVDEIQPRAATAAAPWLDGAFPASADAAQRQRSIFRSAEGTALPGPGTDGTGNDLQTQLNLLRERSWSEQQSLRRQLDDQKADNEKLRKELEGANVRIQELQNEKDSIKEMFDVASAIEKTGSAAALIEEKNALIRHLENLSRELASKGSTGVMLMPPSRELASGGGTMSSLGMSALNLGRPSGKEQQLHEELKTLRAEREKEQEDLKELEQVVVVFETKMEALKKENKELKRQTAQLKSMHAQSMAAQAQSLDYNQLRNAPIAQGSAAKLDGMIENMSILMCSLHDRNAALGSLISSFCRWKASAPRSEKNDASADHRTSLEFQLKKAEQKIAHLKEEMESMMMRHTNLLETEQAQSGMMAQRLLSSEESAAEKDKEIAKLSSDKFKLEQELDSSQRRLASTSAMLSSGVHGASEEVQSQTMLIHALEDDVASLKIVRSNLTNRIAFMRNVGASKAVREKDRSCLMHKFQVWRMLPYFDRHVATMVFQSNRGRNKFAKIQAFQQWFEQACLMSKAELHTAEECSKEQIEYLKSKLAAEREAASSLSTSHTEVSARCEQLSEQISHLKTQQQSLTQDLNSGVASRRHLEKLHPAIMELIGGVGKIKDELDMLQTMYQCAVSENQGLRESMARLTAERDAWFEERARVQQRQSTREGGGTADANVSLLRDRCRVVTSKLDSADLEISSLRESMADAKKLSDELQALAEELQSKGLLFTQKGVPRLRTQDFSTEANPMSRARMLACDIRIYFQSMMQNFAGEGPAGSDTDRLHDKVQELMAHLSDADEELKNCKQEAKHQIDARQQEIVMLSSSLVLAKNEVKYLQDVADGSGLVDVYTRSVKSMETVMSSLNKKYAKKVAECQGLERQLNVLMRSHIDKQHALEFNKRHLSRSQNGGPDVSQASTCAAEKELQMQLQERDRELEIAREKMSHCMDSSNALTCEVQELTALWRASANELFHLNEIVTKNHADMQGLRSLSDILKAQVNTVQEENRTLSVKMDEAARHNDTLKDQLNASKETLAGLKREVAEGIAAKTALQSSLSELQASVNALKDKHINEITAREQAEKQLVQSTASFEQNIVHLRRTLAVANQLSESTARGLRSLCSEMQPGIQSLATCIAEQQHSQNLLEIRVLGASTSNETLAKRLQECEVALRSAQDESSRLQQDMVAMRNETDSLQDQLHENSGQNISLTKEIRKLTALKENMEMELKKLNETCDSQRSEIADLKQRVEASSAKHEEDCDVLRHKLKSQTAEAMAQQKELAEEKQRIITSQRTVHQLEEELAGSRSTLESVNASHSQLSQQLMQLREENLKQKMELDSHASQFKVSQKQQAQDLSNALQDLDRIKSENQMHRERIQLLDADVSDAKSQLSRVTAEKTELQGALESQSNQTHAWLAKAQELQRNATAKDAELMRIREAAEKSDTIRRETEQSMQAAQRTTQENLKSLQSEMERDRQEKTKLESEKNYLQERVQKLKNQLEAAQDDVREREVMIEEIQEDAFVLQVKLLESLDCIKARESSLSSMEARFSSVIDAFAQSRNECEKRQKLLDHCRAEIDTKSHHLDLASENCADLKRKLHQLTQSQDHLRKEMEQTVDDERQEVEKSRAKIQELEGALESAEAKGAELQAKIQKAHAERVSLQEAWVEQKTVCTQVEQKLAAVQQEKEAREKELHSCSSKLSEAGRVMEAFHAEKERFRLKATELQRELDAAKSNLNEKESDYVELERNLKLLHSALDSSKDALAEWEQRCAAKTEQIEEFQCHLTQVGAQLAAANKEVESQKILHSKQTAEFENVRQALNDQAVLVTEAEEKAESLREEFRLKEAAAQELVASLEQQSSDLTARLSEKEAEVQAAKNKHAQVKVQYDALMTRCSELDEENAKTTLKLSEYDAILQTKGKELAKMHGCLAETRSLAEDAELRVQSMKVMEEKLKRNLASKDKQLKSLQQNLLDSSIISTDGAAESLEDNGMIGTMEKEYAQLQERFRAVQDQCASLQQEADAAKREAANLMERLQRNELEVVALRLEIETKQGELDGLHGKVSRLEQAMAANAENDEFLSKATTARVTPTRGVDFNGGLVHGEQDGGQRAQQGVHQLAVMRQELTVVRQELEGCREKLKHKAQLDLARLTVRCHKSVLRREDEQQRYALLQGQVQLAKESSQSQLCELQKQLVEKTDLLLSSEKKFAQLLAWVQKNQGNC